MTVTTPGGTSGSKPYTYDPLPTLTSVTPNSGKAIAGNTVTLTGSGFRTGATAVTFGAGNPGLTVHVIGTTTLTVKVPGHAAATVTVTVSTPGGVSGAKVYTYLPVPVLTSVTPSTGKLTGGTSVTSATGFLAAGHGRPRHRAPGHDSRRGHDSRDHRKGTRPRGRHRHSDGHHVGRDV